MKFVSYAFAFNDANINPNSRILKMLSTGSLRYTEQIWSAVHFYSDILGEDNVIIAGDFNSNSIWDKPKRVYNHTNLVKFLMTKNILSTYHNFHNQVQGEERDSTLFMHRKIDRPYHIDYCFASENLIRKLKNVEVGTYEAWTKYSDHKPLIVDFELDFF